MSVQLHHIQNTNMYVQYMLKNCNQYTGAFKYIAENDTEFPMYFKQVLNDFGVYHENGISVLYEDYLFYLPEKNIFATPNYIIVHMGKLLQPPFDKICESYYESMIKFVKHDMIPEHLIQSMIDYKIIGDAFETKTENCHFEFEPY